MRCALERGAVVDETDAALPGQLHDRITDERDAFAEVPLLELLDLQDRAVLELHLADAGLPVQPGPFVEHAVGEDEPLRERLADRADRPARPGSR